MTDPINNGGGLNREYIVDMKITAFDEGEVIWRDIRSYDPIEVLIDDAEAGIKSGPVSHGDGEAGSLPSLLFLFGIKGKKPGRMLP